MEIVNLKVLLNPVSDLDGVGVKTAEALSQLKIKTIYDLLFYFPRRYDSLETFPLNELKDGQKVLLKGKIVTDVVVSRYGYHNTRLNFKMQIDHDIIMVNFFNQPWLKKQLQKGNDIAIYGKYVLASQTLSAYKIILKEEGFEPVYSLNSHIKQKKLVSFISQAIEKYLPQLPEVIPQYLRDKYKLLDVKSMIIQMHQPKDLQQVKIAQRTAIFLEFFVFQLQLSQLLYANDQKNNGIAKKYDSSAINELKESINFQLSDDQIQAICEILADLASAKRMNRLLQGDVGSGKTIVAVFAIFACITAGYQVALMVPTEILAQQHMNKIVAILEPLGVRCALLTSSTKLNEKKEIYRELKDGIINLVIGTHAIIQDPVIFKKLGLVIIDEQHRFGVDQRKQLLNKGKMVDILAMSATPIPRTLALSVYGENSVSEIHQMPFGRKKVISYWITSDSLRKLLTLMNEQLEQGFQIYVVAPLIAESDKLHLKNAETLYKKMALYFGSDKVALLHGKMASSQKSDIMGAFIHGSIKILITTSVIEVGVDVANANMMIIFNADHFGLSQLHQLRGRIGRGSTQSYCIFVSDPKTDSAKKRLKIISTCDDGFALAREDLKLRGEGDIFGQAQSGIPQFKLGDIINNYNIFTTAQKESKVLVNQNPELVGEEYDFLKLLMEYDD